MSQNLANATKVALFSMLVVTVWVLPAGADDPLPSWNDGPSKTAIVDFVSRVTEETSPDFVPVAERIAVFDNDGTLWCEQPLYVQAAFVVDRVKTLTPQHPEWRELEPFKSLLKGDVEGVVAQGEKGIAALMMATHSGISVDEFNTIVSDWIATARHPKTGKPYTAMVYQPMLEVLAHLRNKGFKTYIVTGGGVDFVRPWAEQAYGIPPEQVIGSRGKLKFELQDGSPVLMKLAEVDLIDDGPGKPVGIGQAIGRRPLMAFGNSDGDIQMLQWTTLPRGAADHSPRFALIVHHTDAEREWAYDRNSHIGKLDKSLDEAAVRGWTVVDMKNEWKEVFPQ